MQVVFVGALPPPVHGASLANAAVVEILSSACSQFTVLPTGSRSLKRGISRFSRAPRVLMAYASFVARFRRSDVVYISLAGGWGKLYDFMFVAWAWVCTARVVFHHHSFSYIDTKSFVSSWMFKLVDQRAAHVVLSQGMGIRLAEKYELRGEFIPVSNVAYGVGDRLLARPRKALKTVGFISNISLEKGIDVFLDVAGLARLSGSSIKFLVAGPFQDDSVEKYFSDRVSTCGNVEYLGSVYGPAKSKFFDEIDLLLFPSRYANEAEPIVVLEALSSGVPVLSTARGCLPDVLINGCGKVLPDGLEFCCWAWSQVEVFSDYPHAFSASSLAAFERVRNLTSLSSLGVASLLKYVNVCRDR